MKTNALILCTFASSLFSTAAHAVKVKDCPEQLTVRYESPTSFNDSQILKENSYLGETRIDEEDLELLAPARRAFDTLPAEAYEEVVLTAFTTRSGLCTYMPPSTEKPENLYSEDTRLMTRNGKDYLRVSIVSGKELFWIYHQVLKISPESIVLKEQPYGARVLGYESPGNSGGPLYNLGKFRRVSVAVGQ